VSYQVNWEIVALDQAAGFLSDDAAGNGPACAPTGHQGHG
jgi:hypothetical protein